MFDDMAVVASCILLAQKREQYDIIAQGRENDEVGLNFKLDVGL